MAKNRKQNTPQRNNSTDPTEEIVKKVKSLLLETIVREWLNAPCKEWGGKSPLQMIKKGEGQQILDSLKLAEEELKIERNPKKETKNGTDNRSIEESVSEEGSTHPVSQLL
jgi:hypothetical protein